MITRSMGYRGYGTHGQWGTGVWTYGQWGTGVWGTCMGNEVQGYGHIGNGVQGAGVWGTYMGKEVQGYGAHVWAMRYRGVGHGYGV